MRTHRDDRMRLAERRGDGADQTAHERVKMRRTLVLQPVALVVMEPHNAKVRHLRARVSCGGTRQPATSLLKHVGWDCACDLIVLKLDTNGVRLSSHV